MFLQEVIFSSSDSTISKKISKLIKEGKIRKIAARIWKRSRSEKHLTMASDSEYSIFAMNSAIEFTWVGSDACAE